jgi:hypothetical protein
MNTYYSVNFDTSKIYDMIPLDLTNIYELVLTAPLKRRYSENDDIIYINTPSKPISGKFPYFSPFVLQHNYSETYTESDNIFFDSKYPCNSEGYILKYPIEIIQKLYNLRVPTEDYFFIMGVIAPKGIDLTNSINVQVSNSFGQLLGWLFPNLNNNFIYYEWIDRLAFRISDRCCQINIDDQINKFKYQYALLADEIKQKNSYLFTDKDVDNFDKLNRSDFCLYLFINNSFDYYSYNNYNYYQKYNQLEIYIQTINSDEIQPMI